MRNWQYAKDKGPIPAWLSACNMGPCLFEIKGTRRANGLHVGCGPKVETEKLDLSIMYTAKKNLRFLFPLPVVKSLLVVRCFFWCWFIIKYGGTRIERFNRFAFQLNSLPDLVK